ncbi:MAG: hypothetical protein OSA97_02825 [Nevskia sp.]|nr:hypothetical protein [Nevskia sp.]
MTEYTWLASAHIDPELAAPLERSVRGTLSGWAGRNCYADGADFEFMDRILPIFDFMMNRYFRVNTIGWERFPEVPCLPGWHPLRHLADDGRLVPGGRLVARLWRIPGAHGTAHDALIAIPGLGAFFPQGRCHSRRPGASHNRADRGSRRGGVAGRRGSVKQAILFGIPIVSVATADGADTVLVLLEGRWLAKALQLKKLAILEIARIFAGLPFGSWPESALDDA